MSTPHHDIQAIRDWLEQRDVYPQTIVPLAGDVSLRRYYRVIGTGQSSILAYYPQEIAASCQLFLETTTLLLDAGVPVPEILEADPSNGLIWLEDLGKETLYDHRSRNWSELRKPLSQALRHREAILSLPREAAQRLNPQLDGPSLDRELETVFSALLEPRGFFPRSSAADGFRELMRDFCSELGEGPSAPCHRDFMARNLIPHGEQLVVIDHQDLRIGPTVYDLASLLNDSLFPPPEIEAILLGEAALSPEETRLYHLACIQRTLKAAGTFASFAQRGHARHLPLIAPSLLRTLAHLEALEESRARALALAPRWRDILARPLSS